MLLPAHMGTATGMPRTEASCGTQTAWQGAGLLDPCHSRALRDTSTPGPCGLQRHCVEVPGLLRAPIMVAPFDAPTSPPLRIAHVLAPGATGGLERVALGLGGGLGDAGHDARLVLLLESAAHPLADTAAARGVPTHPVVLPPHSYIREWSRLRRLFSRLRPHIVHTHGYHADIIGGMAAWSVGVPTVSTLHGFTGGGSKNRMYEALQRFCIRRGAATIAVSAPMAADLGPLYPPGRLRLIRNALCSGAPILERQAARAAFGLPEGGLVVGWIGRLSPEKGPDILVESVPLSRREDFTVSIVGTGRQAEGLQARSRTLGLQDRIRFHGMVPDAGAMIRAFDLLVISSRTEGTPMVLLEAMAAGVPVVTTTVGGIPDVVGEEDAFLAPPQDPRSLAEALDRALEMGDAERRASRAKKRLERDFGAAQWIQTHVDLYRSLVRTPSPAPATVVTTP